jgi:multiple sugar transport system substrate-binding protein
MRPVRGTIDKSSSSSSTGFGTDRVDGSDGRPLATAGPGARLFRLTRRQHVVAATLAVGAAGLAACGTQPGGDGAPAAGPTQGPAAISYSFWDAAAGQGHIDENIAAFQTGNPKITVDKVQIDVNGYDAKVIAMISGGTPPDVLATLRPTFPSWVVKGITLPLDAHLARARIKESDFYPNVLASWRVDGKLHGVNRSVDVFTLWYNPTLLQASGVKAPDDTWTWDTLVQAGQRLTKRDMPQPQWGYATNGFNNKLWVAIALANGARLSDTEVLPKRLLLNQPGVTDALQFVADLRHKWRVMPSPAEIAEHGDPQQLFIRGRIALWFGEATRAPSFATQIKDFAPDVAVPPKGKQLGTWRAGAGLTVARAGKQTDAAALFALFCAGTDGQKTIARTQQGVPTVKAVAESDLFLQGPGPAGRKAWLQSFDWSMGPPATPTWPEIESALTAELATTWNDNRPAKDSVLAAWPKVETLMQEADALLRQMPKS